MQIMRWEHGEVDTKFHPAMTEARLTVAGQDGMSGVYEQMRSDPLIAEAFRKLGAGHELLEPSECGHQQPAPTGEEIAGCPEIIARRCPECARELWWNVDRWRKA